MSRLNVSGLGYEAWFCTDLETECPDCEEKIIEPAGELSKFLELLDNHMDNCPATEASR